MSVNAIAQASIPIPFLRADFPPGIETSLVEVFESRYVGAGKKVEEFELALSHYLGAPYVLCTSSCTAALTLAYAECGVLEKKVVLASPMTCAASNIPLLQLGAEIHWLDVDPLTGNVTKGSVERGIKERPEASLVVIVDWGGNTCDYSGIEKIAAAHGVPLVLDAAQSFGSEYRGSLFGSKAEFVCYSFGPTKILSSIEGGAILPRSQEAAVRLRAARWYGIDRDQRDKTSFWEYDVQEPGFRFTSNDVFATIGKEMLGYLPARLLYNRRLAAIYLTELASVAGLRLPTVDPFVLPNYWMFTVLAEGREALLRKLHSNGVHGATPHRRNDHLGCFKHRYFSGDLPGVDSFSGQYLCLPIGPWVTEQDCYKISEVVTSGW
jgi:perosamine synthetase